MPVTELRLVVTVDDYDAALAFYRDALGLPARAAYAAPNGGRVTLLDAGRATVEIADATAMTRRLADAGAAVVAEPTLTPWNSLNARLHAPDGVQVTLFEELDAG